VLGGWAQDLCGDVEAVILARRGQHYVALSVPLATVYSGPFTCDDRTRVYYEDCAARERCVQTLFADAARRKSLKRGAARLIDSLVFSK
jgi:hypothetical protein